MPLLVCATPIGNLEDVTYRVVRALASADLIVAEDTRRTASLLRRYEIAAETLSLDRHREARRVAQLLPRLQRGETVALVSDAGLPAISDPGGRVIDAALDAGLEVTVLPGPSAVETALVASGLAATEYGFVGFVPRTAPGREALWRRMSTQPGPIVAFESPQRLPATLASLASFDGERRVAVCRELTKMHEEVVRGTAGEVARAFAEPTRGEVTIVIGPPGAGRAPRSDGVDLEAVGAVTALVAEGVPRRKAASIVGALVGRGANELYDASLSEGSAG